MLPRSQRLSRVGFRELGSARRLSSTHFSVVYRKTEGSGKCAVVVSKKIARLSVVRHRLKRRMSAVMARFCGSQISFIVYARAGSAELTFKVLECELSELLQQLVP